MTEKQPSASILIDEEIRKIITKKEKQTSYPSDTKYKGERKINSWISGIVTENDQQRIELKVGNTKYSNMPEWTYNFRENNLGHTFLRKVFTKNNGQKDFEVFRIQPDGIVVRLRGFKDIQDFDVQLDYFKNIRLYGKNYYNFHAGFWKRNTIENISNSVRTIRYYKADSLIGDQINPVFIRQQDVNEEFVNAELERCKRKAGGKRKLEEVGQGKSSKLEMLSPEDQQEKKNHENRLKEDDDLKENLEAPKKKSKPNDESVEVSKNKMKIKKKQIKIKLPIKPKKKPKVNAEEQINTEATNQNEESDFDSDFESVDDSF